MGSWRWFAIGCLALAPLVGWSQPAVSEVVSLVEQRGLGAAASRAASALKDKPGDAVLWHVLGVLQIGLGRPAEAEESFTKELELGAGPAATGLEETVVPGSPLYEALQRQKAAVTLSAGAAAARNNRGAARLLQGKFEAALDDLDQAAVLEPDWGAPWLNGAIANVELDRIEQAEKNARMALSLGEKNARAYTVLGEVELKAGRLDRAEDDVRSALEIDSRYPFALLLRAKLKYRQSRSREAERSLIQALAGGPAVVADSRLGRRSGEAYAIAGTAGESHVRLFQLGVLNGTEGYRFLLQDDRMRVEDRGNADQRLSFGEAAYAGSLGALYFIHRDAAGGRPGPETSIAGTAQTPDARYGLRQTQALYLKSFSLGRDTDLLLHGAFRKSKVTFQTNAASPVATPIDDEQVQGEMRLDHRTGRGLTTLGLALGSLRRGGTGGTPVDPAEQTMPIGTTSIWTAYAVHRRPLIPRVDITFGVIAGGADINRQTHLVADLGFHVGGGRVVHLRVTPRFNDSLSNLIPLDLVADPPQDNSLDRDELTTSWFNHSPAIQGIRTKMIDFELVLNQVEDVGRRIETVLFNRRLNDVNILAADTRVASSIQVTPVTNGGSLGIEERMRFALSPGLSLRLMGRLQTTDADFRNPTYEASAFPVLVPTSVDSLPNFPKVQASARFDLVRGDWLAGLEINYVGSRLAAVPGTAGGGAATFVLNAPAATGANLIFNRRIGKSASFSLMVFNIGAVSFFPGYPGATTALASYVSRF